MLETFTGGEVYKQSCTEFRLIKYQYGNMQRIWPFHVMVVNV